MKTIAFSPLEKEMANFNFEEFKAETTAAKAAIAKAQDIADVKTQICSVWSKIRKYVIWAENVPVAGKFIVILAELLDAICGTAS